MINIIFVWISVKCVTVFYFITHLCLILMKLMAKTTETSQIGNCNLFYIWIQYTICYIEYTVLPIKYARLN